MEQETQKERLTPYLVGLMALLFVATFLEGYDFFIVSLILDNLGKDFHIKREVALYGLSVINIGAVFGFFAIRFGDRIGRKPVFIISIVSFGILSIATSFSPNYYAYVALQFLTKMFLVTEFHTAIIMISEEFPPRIRATAVGVLEMAGGFGGVAAAIFSKYALPAWGWRAMYMVGGVPLILAPIVFFYVRETKNYLAIRNTPAARPAPLWHIWTTPSRKNVALVGAVWFLCYLCYAGMIYSWVLFAKTERGWSESQVGVQMGIATVLGMTGYIVAGAVMDAFGRRIASCIFLLCASGSLVWAFTASGSMMLPSLIAAIFFIFSLIPICSTYNAEMFPTELRAQAAAWCNFLLGRPAQVVAPTIVALLIAPMGGIGAAVKLLAIGPVIAAFMIFFLFPETKGIKMDRIH
ncbi:MAG: MFS transporter [bacterium]